MPLHIVIDARRIRDFGIGTYIRSLVHALGGIDHENRYTLVSGPGDVRSLAGLPGNFQTSVYTRGDADYLDNIAFPVFLKGLAPDLVHIPLNRVPLFMIKPYVVTIHDMANLLFEEEHSKLWMHLRRYRFRRGLLRADRVIAVSEATLRDVRNLMGVQPDRIRKVYNAPDPGFFASSRTSGNGVEASESQQTERRRILERYQINYPFLLYAGNIRRHKNVPRLVEAFAVVRDQLAADERYRDLRLVIIGDTISQYPAVRQAVIKSRVENAVRFLGFVPFDTLRCFYETAAVFVFPSRYEGFGLPPLEAMASGTPVVTSKISSLPEVVGDAAILVNPENVFDIARGIREVLLDETLRAELIRRGREQASRFSWERTAREVLEIYYEATVGAECA
ncbi:MAG TPA: glycosyltransferase family 1 protein [Bryobacteraceae bacterium]|nr:glycosyltransferase family 1 protein [Bryobacteraceae bacterium]